MNLLTISLILLLIILIILVVVFCFLRDSFKDNININVYVSMTTIPERLKTDWWYNNLKRNMSFLKSNYTIIINIPYYSLKGEKYVIPDNVIKLQKENYKQLILNRVDKDEGPITKLLPTLRNNKIKDSDIIIICDDDLYYKPHIFKILEKAVNSNENKISTMCVKSYWGCNGTGFKKYLLKNILNFNYPKSCIKVDDEIIRYYIYKNKIKYNLVLYKNKGGGYCTILKKETDKNRPKWYELNKDNRSGHTYKCLSDLKKIK